MAVPPPTAASRRTSAGVATSAGAHFGGQDAETLAAKLSDPALGACCACVTVDRLLTRPDVKIKMTIANELRDSLDMYSRDIDPAKFFEFLLPCFMEILSLGKPTLASGTSENV